MHERLSSSILTRCTCVSLFSTGDGELFPTSEDDVPDDVEGHSMCPERATFAHVTLAGLRHLLKLRSLTSLGLPWIEPRELDAFRTLSRRPDERCTSKASRHSATARYCSDTGLRAHHLMKSEPHSFQRQPALRIPPEECLCTGLDKSYQAHPSPLNNLRR